MIPVSVNWDEALSMVFVWLTSCEDVVVPVGIMRPPESLD